MNIFEFLRHSGLTAFDFFEDVDLNYGVDNDGPVPVIEGTVTVPEMSFELSEVSFAQLQRTIDPLAPSDEYSIDLYEQTLFFFNHL